MYLAIFKARLRRWWYLFVNSVYTGEVAVAYWATLPNGSKMLLELGSGRPAMGSLTEYVGYRIWWQHPQVSYGPLSKS